MAESSEHGVSRFKCELHDKAHNGGKIEFRNKKGKGAYRGNRGGKTYKSKLKCYNYEKLGQFVHECTEPEKVQVLPKSLLSYDG